MEDEKRAGELTAGELAALRHRIAELEASLGDRGPGSSPLGRWVDQPEDPSKQTPALGGAQGAALFENMLDGFAYHQVVLDDAGKPIDYIFLEINPAFEELTGLRREDVLGKRVTDALPGIEDLGFDWIGTYGRVALTGEPAAFEQYFQPLDRWYQVRAYCPERGYFIALFQDVTASKRSNEALSRIEWLLSRGRTRASTGGDDWRAHRQPYGDLVSLNSSRLLADSIGQDLLTDIASDYLDLLDTSAAVYERNGDYALELFSSGWCRFLDNASRNLADTTDNREALTSGRWHCHESCWKNASKVSIDTGETVDIECTGGIRIHAVPVRAGGETVGSINFGYGDPPRDPVKLKEIAGKFGVDASDLRVHAEAYESRPPFIIELAKKRLATSARLIGEIVERKRAQSEREGLLAEVQRRSEELAVERDRLQVVLDSIADEVWFCDRDGNVGLVNRSAAAGLGLGWAEELREPLGDLVSNLEILYPDGRPRPPEDSPLLRSLREGRVITGEEIVRHTQTGKLRYRHYSASPVRGTSGDTVGAVAVVRDMTELTELERLKGQFVEVAAHELKTPITIMKGNAQALLRRADGIPPERRKMVDAINRGADRIDKVVNELLDISRLQSGHLELTLERVDLGDLVEEVVDRMALDATRHQLRAKILEPVVVQGDRGRLEQVVVNLLDNAMRYSPRGGKVEAEVAVREHEAVISVSDQGVGIPRDKQSRIFERFYRAHTGTPYDYGGMGVGLYISREVISRHGGKMEFESEEETGSTFRFRLPLWGRDGGN